MTATSTSEHSVFSLCNITEILLKNQVYNTDLLQTGCHHVKEIWSPGACCCSGTTTLIYGVSTWHYLSIQMFASNWKHRSLQTLKIFFAAFEW